MKAVIQRVSDANLKVNGNTISEISQGLVVFYGVEAGDTEDKAEYMARKIVNMRIFEDDNGKMNKSLLSEGYSILLVSQFTLCADCSHGNRPGFTNAEEPKKAEKLYNYMAGKLRDYGANVKMGVFGADMKINQTNDGPVTIIFGQDR